MVKALRSHRAGHGPDHLRVSEGDPKPNATAAAVDTDGNLRSIISHAFAVDLHGSFPRVHSFAGGAEMLGGVLLFIPAFTAIGALVSIAVMSNVFMLNMCYDVPVEQFSFHLLLMGVFLLAPDMRRLAELFFFHRRVELYSGPALFKRKWVGCSPVGAGIVLRHPEPSAGQPGILRLAKYSVKLLPPSA